MHVCLKRLLALPLATILSVSAGAAQFGPAEFERDQSEEERLRSEQERDLLFRDVLEPRRQAAHDRLEDAASTIQSQAICLAFVGLSPEPSSFQKRIPGPFRLRFAPSVRQP